MRDLLLDLPCGFLSGAAVSFASTKVGKEIPSAESETPSQEESRMGLSRIRLTASIAVTDMDRAREFYEGKLGLSYRRRQGISPRAGGGKVAWFKDPDGNTFAVEGDR